MEYIIARLKEPSTWAGLSALVAIIIGHDIDQDTIGAICGGFAAVIAICTGERP